MLAGCETFESLPGVRNPTYVMLSGERDRKANPFGIETSLPKRTGGLRPPIASIEFSRSQHLGAVNVDGVTLHRSRHGDMMSFMTFQGIRVIDHQNFLIAVGHDHHLRSGS